MRLQDAQGLEAQFNNRQRVPDSAAWMARWTQASRLTRERLGHVPDLPYGDSAAETLDVFPAQAPNAPVLVFLHGGYWRALDKSDHSFVAPSFVRAGAMVVVPNYGLCPAVAMPDIVLQCAQALAWVWRHAERFGGDARRIVVVGHSAGGHLAAMLLACRWQTLSADLPPRLLAGAMALSGLFDLEPLRRTPSLQADLRLTPAQVRRLSPAFFARPRGPLVALVGAEESEAFITQNQLIRDQWGPRTVPVCQALPGLHHFSVLTDLVDAAGRAHAHALRLLGLPPGQPA